MLNSAYKLRWSSLLIPGIILLFLLLDIFSRLIPLDYIAYRGWEVVTVERAPEGPFAANKHYFNPWASGDLAWFGHLPQLRQPRHEQFTTDAFGYRNPTDLQSRGPVEVVLFGDSFTVGCANSDEEDLSARLMALSNHVVYNAAGVTSNGTLLHIPDMLGVVDRLGMKQGLVIYGYTERRPLPVTAEMAAPAFAPQTTQPRSPSLSFIERLKSKASNLRVSRLKIIVSRLQGQLEDKPALDRVALRHLNGGEPILFLPEEVAQPFEQREISADFWLTLQAELKKRNLALLVLLIPNKYTVYESLLEEPEQLVPVSPPYLDRLEGALHDADVPVLNLRRDFVSQAESEFSRGKLLYWKDDTHWNAAGIELAARRILATLKEQSRQ